MAKEWKQIQVAYGSGNIIPEALQLLKSQQEEDRERGYWQLQNSVVLQSDLYEGAYYVIEPLLEIAEGASCPDVYRPLDILYEIFNGYASPHNFILIEDDQNKHLTVACRERIAANRERIKSIPTRLEKELKAKADLLESIDNPPPVFHPAWDVEKLLKLITKYRDLVLLYLKNNTNPTDYRPLLVEMKESGISRESAYALFTAMRQQMIEEKNEAYEDVILDLLDYVEGYVAPMYRVW